MGVVPDWVCNCEAQHPYVGPWHAEGCTALAGVKLPVPDLSVQFEEPTVGGLSGSQWSQLRIWEDENRGRCDFDDELNNRCPDDRVNGSRFCDFHERIEETYDHYDAWKDERYGHND